MRKFFVVIRKSSKNVNCFRQYGRTNEPFDSLHVEVRNRTECSLWMNRNDDEIFLMMILSQFSWMLGMLGGLVWTKHHYRIASLQWRTSILSKSYNDKIEWTQLDVLFTDDKKAVSPMCSILRISTH